MVNTYQYEFQYHPKENDNITTKVRSHVAQIFSVKSGVSTTLSPCTIMTSKKLNWQKYCKAKFGAYCEVHKENRPLNNINNEQTKSDV